MYRDVWLCVCGFVCDFPFCQREMKRFRKFKGAFLFEQLLAKQLQFLIQFGYQKPRRKCSGRERDNNRLGYRTETKELIVCVCVCVREFPSDMRKWRWSMEND